SKVRPVRSSRSRVIADIVSLSAVSYRPSAARVWERTAESCCYSLAVATTDDVREYWNRHIHDLDITRHPVGSRGFFDDLDQYHFEKLHHLLRLVAFDGYRCRMALEVGCGAGVDVASFARESETGGGRGLS